MVGTGLAWKVPWLLGNLS